MRKGRIVHSHSARTARFENNAREGFTYVVRPSEIRRRLHFQPLAEAFGHAVRAYADILIIIEFDIIRAVIFNHSADCFKHIIINFRIGIIEKIPVHNAYFFAVPP